jgi:hypothetical protein
LGDGNCGFQFCAWPHLCKKGEGNLDEPTSDREDDDKQGSEAKDEDSAASSADRAKEREREMEESGEENASGI